MMSQLSPTVISEARIRQTVRKMARQIDRHYRERSAEEITLVCVMNASFMFCADLVRALKIASRVVFTKAHSYVGAEKRETSVFPIAEDLQNRHVLIVDTIYDTGETIDKVFAEVRRQTSSVAVAVLIVKDGKSRRPADNVIAFAGMRIGGDPFLVGYGLDYNQRFRDLKDIRIYRPAEKSTVPMLATKDERD